MTTGATGQLGLALPVQGELSGTWGDTVNNGLTQYINIAIAGTLTLTNDGAVTLANTTGDASASNVTSTLTGAGTVTAQFAIVRVTGTLTVAKVVTAPSYSKTYTVVNAATGGIVTFKAAGQTGVSVAVGESAFVYFNGTDYVKVSGTVAVASFQTSLSGLTPSTATTGAVTLAGTLGVASGGTGLTAGTSGGILGYTATGTLASSVALTANALVLGAGAGATPTPMASLGTTTTVLHGNASGAPTFGAVSLTADVTGTLPTANGGTNLTSFTSGGVVYASSTSALATGSNLYFNGTGKLGVGTSTPVNGVSAGFEAVGEVWATTSASNANQIRLSPSTSDANIIYSTYSGSGSYLPLAFNVSGSEQMRLTSTGLGIGTSLPAAKLHVSGDALANTFKLIANTTVSGSDATIFRPADNTLAFSTNGSERARISSDGTFRVKGAGTAGTTDAFQVAGGAPANAARITSGGNLLVGTTSQASGERLSVVSSTAVEAAFFKSGDDTGAATILTRSAAAGAGPHYAAAFQTAAAVTVGSITHNDSVTLYNTTSDYRLKTVIGPVANAGQRIDALQPVEYTWNASGERTRGFLAHQFQEVYAGSVSGTKDAVDAEGKPVYQAMQASTSEVIADLVAEIKSLRQRLAAAGI